MVKKEIKSTRICFVIESFKNKLIEIKQNIKADIKNDQIKVLIRLFFDIIIS
tara:strand:- start:257 stop:412 length:156 start_codon:yes stop_codon:yes gene_type:complete